MRLVRRTVLGMAAALAVADLAATAVPGTGTAAAAAPLRVVATTGMIADVVRGVAGDRAAVTQLMNAGIDPHLYKATRSDMAAMLGADVIVYNGLLLEGKMTDAFEQLAASGRPVVAVTERIGADELIAAPGFGGHHDPHVWMDPTAWEKTIDVVRDALSARDPDGAAAYRANADTLRREFARLDAYARRVLGSVPEDRRVLVTAHDAFNYFGRAYGYEVMGVQGLSTESEAGLQAVERLVDTLVERRIPSVFVETTIPERTVQALVAGAAARGHTVAIGGSLFSDAMGPPGTYEGTYVGMIDHNVTTIARALGGTTPDGGLQGRLASAH